MQVRDHENQPFIPTHFLTVFSRNGMQNGDKYLEIGPIFQEGKQFKIGPSEPADMEFLNDLVSSIKTENFKALKFKSLTPENVWYSHCENQNPTLVWFKAREDHQLYFSKDMGVESGLYRMPPMIFVSHRGVLSVYRLDVATEKVKAAPGLKLFMVPLPNIYNASNVCLGDAKGNIKKPKSLEEYIQNMEDLFYKTRFNALHHRKMGKGIVYVDLMRHKNLNKFPFVAAEVKTLKQLIDELS